MTKSTGMAMQQACHWLDAAAGELEESMKFLSDVQRIRLLTKIVHLIDTALADLEDFQDG